MATVLAPIRDLNTARLVLPLAEDTPTLPRLICGVNVISSLRQKNFCASFGNHSKNGKIVTMPTNRLNISIVDDKCIKDLQKLRKQLEDYNTNRRYSLADVVKALVDNKPSISELSRTI